VFESPRRHRAKRFCSLFITNGSLTPTVPEGAEDFLTLAPSGPKEESPQDNIKNTITTNMLRCCENIGATLHFNLRTRKNNEKITPFCIQKAIDSITGKIRNASY
jgi:hypothetical protein